jgi:uncharacterized protein (UPF0332 family)
MLKKSRQKFYSAKDDFANERYDSCVSNLYYSSFQVLLAYSLANNHNFHKHTHVRAYLNKELVKGGVIPKEIASPYNKLMDYRGKADYNYEFFFDKELTSDLLSHAENFNEFMITLIQNDLNIEGEA